MPTVRVHSADADAFIKKFGQPDEATPAGDGVHLRYAELAAGAKETALKVEEARNKAGNPPRKILRFDEDEGKLNIAALPAAPSAPEAEEAEAPAAAEAEAEGDSEFDRVVRSTGSGHFYLTTPSGEERYYRGEAKVQRAFKRYYGGK